MMRNVALGVLVAVLVFGGLRIVDERRAPAPVADAGDPRFGLGDAFAALEYTTLSGARSTTGGLAPGAPLIVFVRDALCPVSRRYGPTTARIARRHVEGGGGVLHLNVSPLDTPESMREDVDRYGLPGSYAVDHEWRIASALGVITTAEAFLFDAERRLVYRGAIDDQYGIRFTKPEARETYLLDALTALDEGRPVAVPSTPPEGCYLSADVHERRIVRPDGHAGAH